MSKHTPGPWGSEELNIRTHGGIDVATVDEQNAVEETDWNVRLIAAAPDLLEALKHALCYTDEDSDDQQESKDYQEAKQATTKAQGGER